jgi:hypothetical protein
MNMIASRAVFRWKEPDWQSINSAPACSRARNVRVNQKGVTSIPRNPLIFLELAMGFEPATC